MSEEQNHKDIEVLYSPQQVAKYLNMSVRTIYNWLDKKRMFDPEKIRKISNRVRIPRSEVERIAGNVRQKLENQNL